ncbi:MAG: CPBP family intramembrane metalloprotease [Bacteroidales bacterium]|nr:CPBP family intramembrane metalloprotease [Bacteroidales bacterium]
MRHIRSLIVIGEMSSSTRLVAGLICLLVVFSFSYPFFLVIGKVAGVDLSSFKNVVAGLDADMGSLKYLQAAQHISLFILPVLFWSWLSDGNLTTYTGLGRIPLAENILLIMLMAFLLFPVNSYASSINQGLRLPEWLSGVETWILGREAAGEKITIALMSTGNIAGLVTNLLVLAILPAFGEELFFRGFLQKNLGNILQSGHLAVVVTAIIFSTLHFQFLGFLPRFLLGVFYGYLFLWSQSVWLPVIAHFVNNAVPVMLSYLYGWSTVNSTSNEIATDKPVLPAVSLIALVALMLYSRRILDRQVNGKPRFF